MIRSKNPKVREDVVAPVATASASEGYVSKRGRRVLATVIVLLIILLLATSAALFGFLSGGKGSIADPDELGELEWVRSIYGFGPDPSQMVSPASAAIDPDNGFWLGDQGSFRMVQFDAAGKYVDIFAGDAASGDSFDFPTRIAIAPDGWRYIAQSTYANVKVYSPEGTLEQTLTVPAPSSIAVNDDMVAVGFIAGFVAFDRDGNPIGQIGGQRGVGDDEFDVVNGIALDSDNNVYVVDSFNNRISKYDALGDRVWMVRTGPPSNQGGDSMRPGGPTDEFPAGMQTPMGATIDGSGRLVVVDLLDFSIAAFSTEDGSFLGKWGDYGSEDGKLSYPSDVDYDPRYDWFVVSDSGNQRAQIVRIPDSGGGLAETARRAVSGPIKVCCIPFVLLVILLVIWWRRRRKEEVVETYSVPVSDIDSPPAG